MPSRPRRKRTTAAMWLIKNTYPCGYGRTTNPLAGHGGSIRMEER